MDLELERIAGLVRDARDPEDLFGAEPMLLPRSVQREKRQKSYEAMKAITSLQYASPDDNDLARDLDLQISRLYKQALERIEIGAYNLQGRGQSVPAAFRGQFFDAGNRRYYVGPRFRQGSEATLYTGFLEMGGAMLGEVVVKVASSSETSPYIEREANALAIMRREDYRETTSLPWPLDRFDAGGRLGIVMRRVDGFNLEEVRVYPPHRNGLDRKDMVWMLTRVLSVMGMAHQYGVVHGRICPQHILIEPPTHAGIVVGWGGSAISPARSGQRVLAPVETFSAPEVTGPTVGPWSDVYSIGKSFIWLLGGDPKTNSIPDTVETKLAAFLRDMVNEDPFRRPEDCWQLYETLEGLKLELWGEKKWRPLDMPSPSALG